MDGSYSVYRKWCSGQPKLLEDVENCVFVTTPGCWQVGECNVGAPFLLFICDIRPAIGECSDSKATLLEMVKVLRNQYASIESSCRSCRDKHHE